MHGADYESLTKIMFTLLVRPNGKDIAKYNFTNRLLPYIKWKTIY